MKRTTVLRGVATIFREPHLNLVARQHRRLVRRRASRFDSKTEYGFIERQRRVQVGDRQVHVVALIAKGLLERSLHGASASHSLAWLRAMTVMAPLFSKTALCTSSIHA